MTPKKTTVPAALLSVATASLIGTEFIEETDLCKELGITRRTLARWRLARTSPPRVTVGRSIFYRKAAVLGWLTSHEEQPVKSRKRA